MICLDGCINLVTQNRISWYFMDIWWTGRFLGVMVKVRPSKYATFNLPRFDFAEPKDRRSLDNALEAESCSIHLRLLRLGRVTSISLGHNEKSMTWTGNSTEIVVNSRLLPASPKEKAGCCRRCVEKGAHILAGENIHRGKEVNFFNFPIQSLTLGKRICPFLAGKGKSKGGRDGVWADFSRANGLDVTELQGHLNQLPLGWGDDGNFKRVRAQGRKVLLFVRRFFEKWSALRVLRVIILQQILQIMHQDKTRENWANMRWYEITDNMMHDDMLSADIILHAGLVRLNPKFLRASWRWLVV